MNEGAEMKMTLDTPRQDMRVWRAPLIAVVLAVLALFALYWETVASMAAIWSRSETFTHNKHNQPISLFLIWQRRRELIRYTPAPDLRPIVLLPVLGLVWLLAHYASVQVIEQLAMVAMIPEVVWAILGWQITWALVFPLFFLFFAVPMGEELIPPLMDFTADGLRAYMSVMIAHLSDMRLALGVDHFIYGWAFFGLVMLLLFWIGSYWREDDRPPEQPAIAMAEAAAPPPLRAASPWRAGVI